MDHGEYKELKADRLGIPLLGLCGFFLLNQESFLIEVYQSLFK